MIRISSANCENYINILLFCITCMEIYKLLCDYLATENVTYGLLYCRYGCVLDGTLVSWTNVDVALFLGESCNHAQD